MHKSLISGLGLLALLASPAAAAAQAAPPAPAQALPQDSGGEADIVVEGARERAKEIERFVDALTPAPVGGQLRRFDYKVCPAAVGLTPAQNEAAALRLRRVAAAAGIPVAAAGCRPNTLLIVAPDKDALIDAMRSKYPAYFQDELGNRIKLPKEAGPATAWHVEGKLDADGNPVPIDRVEGYYVSEGTRDSSRVKAATRPHFLASVVVVELKALAGLTTTQLADYAAMRAFADTDPARLARSNAPTILNILDTPMGAAVPLTLTQWDMSFLKSLYAAEANRYAASQRREMRQDVKKDLDRARRGGE